MAELERSPDITWDDVAAAAPKSWYKRRVVVLVTGALLVGAASWSALQAMPIEGAEGDGKAKPEFEARLDRRIDPRSRVRVSVATQEQRICTLLRGLQSGTIIIRSGAETRHQCGF